MISSTYGMITCAMIILLSLVLVPYLFINIACYWLLQRYYHQALSKQSVIYLQVISIPLLLLVFVLYARYAHSFEGLIVSLVFIYLVSHGVFLRTYYPHKKFLTLFKMVGISLIITAFILALYLMFIFNPLCSLIG